MNFSVYFPLESVFNMTKKLEHNYRVESALVERSKTVMWKGADHPGVLLPLISLCTRPLSGAVSAHTLCVTYSTTFFNFVLYCN